MNDAIIIDGNKSAEKIKKLVHKKVLKLKSKFGIRPGLAVVLIGDNPASEVYVNIKLKRTKEIGMKSFEYRIPSKASTQTILNKIDKLNHDPKVNGILIQLPLPDHVDETAVINAIDPLKDVDGFHPLNIGKLWTKQNCLVPCTPQGCLILIKEQIQDISGLKAVVIGRSNIVGKPMASLLLKEDCTVTIVHSKTKNIAEICKQADILVAAVGIPKFVKKEWVKKGAIVIDVGINRVKTADNNSILVGDVDFENVKDQTLAITPVPKGVGPMTIACLLKNTLLATCMQRNINVQL